MVVLLFSSSSNNSMLLLICRRRRRFHGLWLVARLRKCRFDVLRPPLTKARGLVVVAARAFLVSSSCATAARRSRALISGRRCAPNWVDETVPVASKKAGGGGSPSSLSSSSWLARGRFLRRGFGCCWLLMMPCCFVGTLRASNKPSPALFHNNFTTTMVDPLFKSIC